MRGSLILVRTDITTLDLSHTAEKVWGLLNEKEKRDKREGVRLHKGGGVSPWKPVPEMHTSKPVAIPDSSKNECEIESECITRKSVFTLIRTDTTLDLSHKAEKV